MASPIDGVTGGNLEGTTNNILCHLSLVEQKKVHHIQSILNEGNQLDNNESLGVVEERVQNSSESIATSTITTTTTTITDNGSSQAESDSGVRSNNNHPGGSCNTTDCINLKGLRESYIVLNGKLKASFAAYQQANFSSQSHSSVIECREITATRSSESSTTSLDTKLLQKQVNCLKNLIQELSLQGTDNSQYIVDRINDNEILRSFNWNQLPKDKAAADAATDSATATANQPSCSKGATGSRRERRNSRRSGNKVLEQTSDKQLKDFKTYVHNIVGEYLDIKPESLPPKYVMEGPIEDDSLEEYAQKLVTHGLGRIMNKEIRINRKQNRQSFISISDDRDTTERDGMISTPVARRHAFDGDLVRAFVLNAPKNGTSIDMSNRDDNEDYQDETDDTPDTTGESDIVTPVTENCPKAFVIKIIKESDTRNFVVGVINFKKTVTIKIDENINVKHYVFKPIDTKLPLMYLNYKEGEEAFKQLLHRRSDELIYTARVSRTSMSGYCIIQLKEFVGETGNLEAESYAIICKNNLQDMFRSKFEERFIEMFKTPSVTNMLHVNDSHHRIDLTEKCIFTIDPLTARDLDDALSCEVLENGLYEIGVHISDVSYNLPELGDLDEIVKDRANSLYLIDRVIHMLPQTLCELCSLLPGQKKCAFSVIFHVNAEGEVVKPPTFHRSLIQSCAQFAYEHAQKIIDSPNTVIDAKDLPPLFNGFGVKDISQRVLIMHKIAMKLRKKRFDGGALKINNPKLRFECEPNTGVPISFAVDTQTEANYMIEEFMLLANQAAANLIYDRFPNIAILRNHPPPLGRTMQALCERLAKLNINLEWTNSRDLYKSILDIINSAPDPRAMDAFLTALVIKPMARANYLCADGKDKADFWHYGLAVPMYTHFTSPIRRYPDILVHRLLAAALNYCEPPKRSVDELHRIAETCNDQKKNSKNNNDDLSKLYFKHFVKYQENGVQLKAVVTDLLKYSAILIMVETGYSIGIRYNTQKYKIVTKYLPDYILIYGDDNSPPKQLKISSSVDIRVYLRDNSMKATFVLPEFDVLAAAKQVHALNEAAQRNDASKRNNQQTKARQHQQQQQLQQRQVPQPQNHKRQHGGRANQAQQQQQQQLQFAKEVPKGGSAGNREEQQNQNASNRQRQFPQSSTQNGIRIRPGTSQNQRQTAKNIVMKVEKHNS